MNKSNLKIDAYLRRATKWRAESEKLRSIALDCGLTEEMKWGKPCYTVQKKNIVLIGGFKEFCALLFFKGVLLKDARRLLVSPGENSQSSRLIRFINVREIAKLKTALKAYIREAIAVERAGVKVRKRTEPKIPEELQSKFAETPALKTAFYALTPGRQRAYGLYFSAAKQSKTRAARIDKCMPQILKGKGLND